MGKPILYGVATSRALRAIWGMEETGIDYDHAPTHYGPEAKTPEYLAINPNGRVPALVDGDLRLFESTAINLYLAKTYAPALYPQNAADEARAWQWSIWAMSEIEPLQMPIAIQKIFTPKDQRDPALIEANTTALERPLKVLDQALAGRDWLIGEAFSVADLNVAAVMNVMELIRFDFSHHANVRRWADACYARPALARAKARG